MSAYNICILCKELRENRNDGRSHLEAHQNNNIAEYYFPPPQIFHNLIAIIIFCVAFSPSFANLHFLLHSFNILVLRKRAAICTSTLYPNFQGCIRSNCVLLRRKRRFENIALYSDDQFNSFNG